jgi:hypothetical protein
MRQPGVSYYIGGDPSGSGCLDCIEQLFSISKREELTLLIGSDKPDGTRQTCIQWLFASVLLSRVFWLHVTSQSFLVDACSMLVYRMLNVER